MLAYRHAFHAGNHADVLKHLVFTQVLRYMAEKDKPYTLIDTHAGAGAYALGSSKAQKTAEYQLGIAKLWQRKDLLPALADYLALVGQFNPEGRLKHYPGSPMLADLLLRAQDRLRLYELHSSDFALLSQTLGARPNTQVSQLDGFGAPRADLPPPSRRAVVLMDPSYEVKTDYAKVLGAVREGLQKFSEGVFVIWYPQLQRLEPKELVDRLKATANAQARKGWLHVRMTVAQPDASGFGMFGSGLVVINPPHVLKPMLEATLPPLLEALAQYDGANFVLEQQVA
ncbi:MAG: hypothetical protein RLY71_1253 [Pseudomonadota bacterium]|jgi:23S rRNA (adenine2030-N6)-methyltransferase